MSCTAIGENGERFIETARCSDHCCRRFYLPAQPSELDDFLNSVTFHHEHDRETIRNMVVPIGPVENNGGIGYQYTCIHFDRETNNCRIYASRPWMCAAFPYGKECTLAECTMRVTCTAPSSKAE